MTAMRDKAPGQSSQGKTSKETGTLAGRVLSDKPARRKPSGPVTYTIQKGANVWPGRSKA